MKKETFSNLISRLQAICISPWFIGVLLILTVVVRLEHETFNLKFHSDQLYQIQTSQKLLEGHGVKLSYTDTTDISRSIYFPQTRYPEGYAYLMAPALYLTNDVFYASLTLNYLAILIYFTGWILIFYHFKNILSRLAIVPFLLITAFNNTAFQEVGQTGLLSMAFLILALGCSLFLFTPKRKLHFSILVGIMLFLTVFFRFAYYPMAFSFPFVLLIIAIFYKDKKLLSHFAAILTTLVILLLFSKLIEASGGDSYFLSAQKGSRELFLEHLRQFNYNFPLQALTDERFFYTLLTKTGLGVLLIPVKLIISITLIGLIISGLAYSLKKVLRRQANDPSRTFVLLMSIGMIAINLAVLCYLSAIKVAENNASGINWTYVREIRYYAPVYMFILFLLHFWAYQRINIIPQKLRVIFKSILICSAIISLLYFPIRKHAEIRSQSNYFQIGESRLWQSSFQDANWGKSIKQAIQDSYINGIRPVYLSHDRDHQAAELMGVEYGGSIINKREDLPTSQPVNLLVYIKKQAANYEWTNENLVLKEQLQAFVEEKQMKILLKSEYGTLYKYTIMPKP